MTKRQRFIPSILGAVLAALLPMSATAETVKIHGVVTDVDGEPVPGIEVTTNWVLRPGQEASARAGRSFTTDAEGRFTVTLGWSSRSTYSLVALDPERGRGAVLPLEESHRKEGAIVELRLEPLVTVRGTLECEFLGQAVESSVVSVTAPPARIAGFSHLGAGTFSFTLPPGRYDLSVSAKDCKRISRRLEVTGKEEAKALDLGTVALEPTIVATRYGKPSPPLTIAAARGVPDNFTLASVRGKWVLLEFWGFW